ncbi:General transcription factor 3C polypeptide 1 like protein [Argiope bruennichi]|uniref:General transcription factor 3C polypeptide 1 like protein n=1 Tax=Argiope bruennichi TaxID=94029 RepID=A0A8T0FG20_ARGBR|nr:General transcription factor 3C polypeptide 1 like protein [Argiope bruennichi]
MLFILLAKLELPRKKSGKNLGSFRGTPEPRKPPFLGEKGFSIKLDFELIIGFGFARNYVLPTFRSASLPTKSKNYDTDYNEESDSVLENTNLPYTETNSESNNGQPDQSMCIDGNDRLQISSKASRNNIPSSSLTETSYFIPRTWRNPNGSLNKPTFFSLLSTVLSHIISNPGISSYQVCEQFSVTLPPVQTLELIEILEKASCVYKYYCKPLKKKSLFSSPRSISVTKNREAEDVDHIEPFPDAVCKIADLRCVID